MFIGYTNTVRSIISEYETHFCIQGQIPWLDLSILMPVGTVFFAPFCPMQNIRTIFLMKRHMRQEKCQFFNKRVRF